VKPDIYEAGCILFDIRVAAGRIRDTQGDVVIFEDSQRPVVRPARMSHLQDVTVVAEEGFAKAGQYRFIKGKRGRQLKEDWAQFFPQEVRGTKKPLQRFPDILDPLDVGDISVGLHRPEEISRCLFAPGLKGLGFGEPVKRGIELNGPVVFGVELKPLGFWAALRIECLPPVIVVPARGTDVDLR